VLGGNSVGVSNMPADPAKSGYTFGGWYTAANGGRTEFTGLTPVNGNMTVYAKWTIIQYTVTFNADGGSPATATRTVNSGSSVGSSDMPANPARSLYAFGGWYMERNGGGTQFTASTVVSGNITVYAGWTALSFNDALAWINANAVEGGAYIITLTGDETIAPKTLSCSSKNVSVTIRGDAAKRTVSLSSNGSLFTVGGGVTLMLDNNITLLGLSGNKFSLVMVNSNGALEMKAGSKISGNNASYNGGGGVYVKKGGTFTMSGGEISGNTSYSGGNGGGVYVEKGGTFTMNGGEISGNTANLGGGVYVQDGTFTKQSGGTIYGLDGGVLKNTAVRNTAGHAVYINNSKKRLTTAGVGVTLDSTKSGSAGGWE
jgi:uncharacterized repeat protein (TIGR02543 family)